MSEITSKERKSPLKCTYVLNDGFQLNTLVRFDMGPVNEAALSKIDPRIDEPIATVMIIPDDAPDTVEMFDPSNPPCIDDFSILDKQIKYRNEWIAHLSMTYIMPPSSSTTNANFKMPPLWYPCGCAVLLQTTALKYVFMGRDHLSFECQPRDEVVRLCVAMHSEEVLEPCAWVVGKNNTYLLNLRKYVSNKVLEENGATENPYLWITDVEDCSKDESIDEDTDNEKRKSKEEYQFDIKNITDIF